MKRAIAPNKIVRVSANRLKPPTPEDLMRLELASNGPIYTTDIPEIRISKRPKGPIWRAVTDEMRRQALSGHRLWKQARVFCPRLPESAVYEFIANKRSVRVDYADAMLQALGLRLTATKRKRAGRTFAYHSITTNFAFTCCFT